MNVGRAEYSAVRLRLAVFASVLVSVVGGITDPAGAASRSWTGGAGSNNWSAPANWGGVAPVAGDDLVFPGPNAFTSSAVNDFPPGTSFSSLTAFDVWTLTGNRIGLSNGLSMGPKATVFMGLPVDLLADQVWRTNEGVAYLDGPLRTGGSTLSLRDDDPNTSSAFWIRAGATGGGAISTSGPGLSVEGSAPVDAAVRVRSSGALRVGPGSLVAGPVDVADGSVGGTGRITGSVSLASGAVLAGLSIGGALTLDQGSYVFTNLSQPSPGFGSTVTVDGPISLDGAQISLQFEAPPAIGSRYTIFDSRGTTPIGGRLRHLPEGQRFIYRSVEFSITYAGGDGNDVVLTTERHNATQQVSMLGGSFGEDVGIARTTINADVPDLSRSRAMRLDAVGGSADADDHVDGFWAVLEAGQSTTIGQIEIVDDTIPEPDETIRLRLSDIAAGTSGAATDVLAEVNVIVTDNDPRPRPSSGPPPTPPATRRGYWMIGDSGVTYGFGDARPFGDTSSPFGVVDIEPTPTGNGYWTVNRQGEVFGLGDARYVGGSPTLRRDETVTAISRTPSGAGYWLFTSSGRVLNYGDAEHFGDMSGVRLNGPVLDSIPTPTGRGYYLVASDGGIFTFGDADFRGSMGAAKLNAPVQSLVPDPDGVGYWLVASDGGIFAFDAAFYGSMGSTPLNRPVTGMVGFRSGYLMVGEDGGIFTFGDAPFFGSLGDDPPTRRIVSVAVLDL